MKAHWFHADASYPSPRIPLPWAASIMILFILPLSFYLGKWNIPLWVSFIVWAQYFVFGANYRTWKIIFPCLTIGAVAGALWCSSSVLLAGLLAPYVGAEHNLYLAYAITNLFWVTLLLYCVSWFKFLETGSLALFNGLTLQLAIYFTGLSPAIEAMSSPQLFLLWSLIWTLLAAYFGWFLGWLNLFLTFPDKPQ